MPTYEYECLKCGENFEVFQMMSDKPIESCPKCHGSVRRLIGSGSGIIFKGSGFYATDYRKSKPTQSNKQEGNQKGCQSGKDTKGPACDTCPSGQDRDR